MKPKILTIFVLNFKRLMKHTLLALILIAVMASGVATAQNTRGIDEDVILTAINDLRTDGCFCGNEEVRAVPALMWDQRLADIALNYAIHLKNNNENGDDAYMFMSHVGIDGSTVETRLADAGYVAKDVVENIAYLRGNENLVIDHWLNNPLSCNNIMSRKMNVMGAARAGNYWVLIIAQTPIKKDKKSKK